MPGSDKVQSVLRALDLLRAIAEAPSGLRLGDMAEATGLGKTTAHNLVRTLCARGFLARDASGRYVMGDAVYEMAQLGRRNAIMEEAALQMRRLGQEFPATVITFSEMTPAAIYCRMRLSPDRPGEIQRPLDRIFTPYVSVTAICLQATGLNAGGFEQRFPFDEHGAGRWATRGDFMKAKDEVRRSGRCLRHNSGTMAIAFAVPENFALGFSIENPPADFLDRVKAEADVFRKALSTFAKTETPDQHVQPDV